MNKLSNKITTGIVNNKDLCVVEKDFNGNVLSIKKIEYVGDSDINRILLDKKTKEDKQALLNNEKLKEDNEAKEKELLKQQKRDVLHAFNCWHRDVTSGIVLFEQEKFEDVINWYRQYLNDNDIEVHNELRKYL